MRSCHAGGFTLIEVLVALLVVAIGIAGAAGTQLSALRTRHGSSLMSQAVELASGLADRMRANAGYVRSDEDNLYATLSYDSAVDGAPPPPSTDCFGADDCDGAAMAAFDVDEVRAALYRGFPGGRIVVCRDTLAAGQDLSWECAADAGAPLLIKIGWRGKRADGTADADGPAVALAVEVMQ